MFTSSVYDDTNEKPADPPAGEQGRMGRRRCKLLPYPDDPNDVFTGDLSWWQNGIPRSAFVGEPPAEPTMYAPNNFCDPS